MGFNFASKMLANQLIIYLNINDVYMTRLLRILFGHYIKTYLMTTFIRRLDIGVNEVPRCSEHISKIWSNDPFSITFNGILRVHSIDNCIDFGILPVFCLSHTCIEIEHTDVVHIEYMVDDKACTNHSEYLNQVWVLKLGDTPCFIQDGMIMELPRKLANIYLEQEKAALFMQKRFRENRKVKQMNVLLDATPFCKDVLQYILVPYLEPLPQPNTVHVSKAQYDKIKEMYSNGKWYVREDVMSELDPSITQFFT
jgi:hypothetical protein